MYLVKLQVPYSYLKPRFRLSWGDVRFGLEAELLAVSAPMELAVDVLSRDEEEPQALVVELAAMNPTEDTSAIVRLLSGPIAGERLIAAKEKWLCIVLSWLYDNRSSDREALAHVEAVYADFDYPPGISHLVRYMPAKGPDLGSRELNESRLIEMWGNFVHSCKREHAPEACGQRP